MFIQLSPPRGLVFRTERARNASDARVTGDEAQGTMRRRKKRGQQIFFERETSEYEAGSVTIINYNALVLGGGVGGVLKRSLRYSV